ncbi:MAG: IS91 family transposase [Nitrospinae bacterium]|nr:IS91 family transposase [Nitrospinota bacterium]
MVGRTAELGGHTEQCPHCGFERHASNSCRNRHGPTCQTLTKAQWVADRQAELLPVPYFHCVFTLPHELNPLVLDHKRPLLTLLFKAVSQTLLQCGHHNLGGPIGSTMVLHTWDQTLGAHCHLHCLIPAGALSPDGAQWLPAHPRFLFPVQALSTVFRGKFLDALHKTYRAGTLTCPEETSEVSPPERFALLTEHLYAKDWVVYVKPAFAGPAQTLDDLGRSTHRVAISNNRIVEVRDGQVRFTYRNRRQGNQVQTMVLEAPEFIRRFLLHVLPQGLQRMRHIGFLANRCKARALRQCRHLLGQSAEPPARCKKTVVEWMRQRTGTDITRCPSCGYGPLQRTALPALLLRPGRPLPRLILDSS